MKIRTNSINNYCAVNHLYQAPNKYGCATFVLYGLSRRCEKVDFFGCGTDPACVSEAEGRFSPSDQHHGTASEKINRENWGKVRALRDIVVEAHSVPLGTDPGSIYKLEGINVEFDIWAQQE